MYAKESLVSSIYYQAANRVRRVLVAVLGGFVLATTIFTIAPKAALAEEGVTRIHILSFLNAGDAIVVESNGRFGLVDSGESNDYPDGSDPRYPYRPGTTIGCGVEDEVLSYLDFLGVTEDNFDFYIGTHPHSDHIGTAGIIIRKYKPSKVYTPRYSDSYMTSSWGLWDNQYVYDNLVSAAEEVGADLYLDFDENAPDDPAPGSNVCRPAFDFGCSHIELVNTDSSYETEGTSDANHISLGVKVTSNGKVAYLAEDICNTDGDEDRLAQTLGHVDFMKLGHHGVNEANTYGYVMALSPDVVYQTGGYEWLWDQPLKAIQDLDCLFYNSEELDGEGIPAFVVKLGQDGIKTNVVPAGLSIVHNHYTGCYEAFSGNRAAGNLKGWHQVKDGFAYFDGGPQSTRNSWVCRDGAYSYVGDNALRVTGWQRIDGIWYHFTDDGIMQTGWSFIDGSWYWFDKAGTMASGLVSIDGRYSSFAESGAWLGYVNSSSGWNLVNGSWYYVNNGRIVTGWLKLGGAWYWFDPDGKMAVGWRSIGGAWYYLDSSGVMVTGWSYINGCWYWFNSSGVMTTGWRVIGSNWYYFSDSGAMQTGWLLDGNSWYWLDASGAMKTGWVSLGGDWYLFNSSAGWMETGWQMIDGSWYYLDSLNGVMKTGWLLDGNDWYYLAEDGVMQRSRWIGNYYVLDDGVMARGQWVGSYYVDDEGTWAA